MVTAVTGPVRLVLVDDHAMVIEGLKAMLAGYQSKVRVIGQAVGAERAVEVIDSLDPDDLPQWFWTVLQRLGQEQKLRTAS